MPAEDDFGRFSELADELELDGEERDNYIGMHMSKKGYKPVTSWADPDPDDGKPAGFSPFAQSKSRQTRQVGGGNRGGNQNRSQYG